MSHTEIVVDGTDTDIVPRPSGHVQFFLYLSFDLDQFAAWNDGFSANFQVENSQSGVKTNSVWSASLAALPRSPDIWLLKEGPAESFGITAPGIHILRPSFTILVPNVHELPSYVGLSKFAVAEEHMFLLEGS